MSFEGPGPEDINSIHHREYCENQDFFGTIGVDEQVYLEITCGKIRDYVKTALQNGLIQTTDIPACLHAALELVSPDGKWENALN